MADDLHARLIAALRAMLGFPQLARHWIPREALGMTMPVAPNGGNRTLSSDKWIVLRHRTIVVHAVDLASWLR